MRPCCLPAHPIPETGSAPVRPAHSSSHSEMARSLQLACPTRSRVSLCSCANDESGARSTQPRTPLPASHIRPHSTPLLASQPLPLPPPPISCLPVNWSTFPNCKLLGPVPYYSATPPTSSAQRKVCFSLPCSKLAGYTLHIQQDACQFVCSTHSTHWRTVFYGIRRVRVTKLTFRRQSR